MKNILIGPIIVFFVVGCQRPMPEQGGWLGAVTLAEGRQLPFRMYLDLRQPSPSGYFLVSDERTQIPEINVADDSLILTISEYGAALRGRWDGERWTGQFLRFRRDTIALDFWAMPGEQPIPGEEAETPAGVRLTGSFRVHYKRNTGIDSSTVAKFRVRGDSVYGTFIDPSGDHGLMAGIQTGSRARLGRFIGWQANLIELEYSHGRWEGKYYARQFPPEVFSLVPLPSNDAKPSDPRRTRMKNPSARFRFEGITVEGDTLRHTDKRFEGKALIVDIMGTWCHNCLDEAPVLRQLYSEFRDEGLEIVGLSFEITDNPEIGRRNLDIYRKRHGLEFPLLYAGSLDRDVDPRIKSQVEDFFAYPTTFFIDRRGKVREVHWGFKGPGTGEDYQREIERFYEYTREILHPIPR